jgi:hypothetical protein
LAVLFADGTCAHEAAYPVTTMELKFMKKLILLTFAILAMPLTAQAQGIIGGAQEGAYRGNRDAGPVGAIVGGTVGAAVGGVEGVIGVPHRGYYYRHHRRYYRD